MRFTAQYTDNDPNDANTYQIAGFGHPEDGYYMGFKGPDFGILHVNRALRHIETLTVSTGSSSAGNITITLNGTPFTVPVSANTGDTSKTAYEIYTHTYNGWRTDIIGSTVIFISGSSGNKTNTFSLVDTDTTSTVGSLATTRLGSAGTETFIKQTEWNLDVMDGSHSVANPSGVLLDPTKFNIYQIDMQYLGVGSVMFDIVVDNSENNNIWTRVHSIRNPNTLTATHVGNPSFPFTMSSYKLASSSQDLIVKSGSVMGGIEGNKMRHGQRTSAVATINVSTTMQTAFIIKNANVYTSKANQTVAILRSLVCATESSNNSITQCSLIRNPVIDITSGDITFREFATGKSCLLIHDANALTVSSYNDEDVLYSICISESGQSVAEFDSTDEDMDIQPDETIAVCLKVNSGSGTVTCSLNLREDQ